MKYSIEDLIEVKNSFDSLADVIRKTEISMSDIDKISRIAPGIKEIVCDFKKWFNVIEPIETRTLTYDGLYVNNRGQVFNLSNDQEIIPFWHNGDLRIRYGGEIRRVIPIIAAAFGIKSPAGDEYIQSVKNGDRRDLRPENICWIPKSDEKDKEKIFLIEDICRRLVDYDGNVDAVVEKYKGSTPVVTKQMIRRILTKEQSKDVSDIFFNYEGGRLVKFNDDSTIQKYGELKGFDTYQFLIQCHMPDLPIQLLKDKVKEGKPISEQEMMMMCVHVSPGKQMHKSDWYVEAIKNEFGYDMPVSMIPKLIAPSSTLTSIKEIFMK